MPPFTHCCPAVVASVPLTLEPTPERERGETGNGFELEVDLIILNLTEITDWPEFTPKCLD